jgi:hypothetical protein
MAKRRKSAKKSPKLSKAKAKARSKARSEAAKKGWVTRRFLANPIPWIVKGALHGARQGLSPTKLIEEMVGNTVKAILRTGKIRTFAQARIIALGNAALLNAADSWNDRDVLRSFVENDDDRWLYYMELCEENDLDLEDARDYWFSPEM